MNRIQRLLKTGVVAMIALLLLSSYLFATKHSAQENAPLAIQAKGAAEMNIKLTEEEQKWIQEHPKIRTLALSEWPPFDYQGKNGTHVGISADILRLAAKRVGLETTPVFGPWRQVYKELIAGRIDLAPDIYYTEDRAVHLAFTRPYLPLYTAVFASPDAGIRSLDDLSGRRVAVEESYAMEEILRREHPEAHLHVVESSLEALLAVTTGEADAYVGAQYVASYLIEKHVLHGIEAVGLYSEEAQALHMATPKDRTILRDIMNKALQSISDKEQLAIVRQYFSAPIAAPTPLTLEMTGGAKKKEIELTAKEKIFLQSHPEIRIGIMKNWPPINFVDRKGALQGIGVDYIEAINNRLGGLITLVPGTFKENLAAVREKSLDGLMDVTPKPEREVFLNFTQPYLDIPHVIVGRQGGPSFNNEDDLKGHSVALEMGFGNVSYFRKKLPDVTVLEYESTSKALGAVSRGEADAYAGNRAVAAYIMEDELVSNLAFQGRLDKPGSILTIGVRKDWPELATILDKVLSAVPRNELREIRRRWSGLDDISQKARSEEQIDLTAEERYWLQNHQTIRVHNEKNWPPFNFNEYGKPSGFSIEYMNLLAGKLGINVEYHTGPEWSEFLDMLRNKKLDVMLNIVKTEDRLRYILFTDPYIRNSNVIVSKKERVFDHIGQLGGMTVAIPKGFFHGEILRKHYPDVKILEVTDALSALKAVSFGEADATLQEEAIVQYLIIQNMLSGLRISGEVDVGDPDLPHLRIGVRDDWPIFQSILNKAIASISQSDVLKLQQRWLALMDARTPLIDLSPEEHAWLKTNNVFQLGVDPSWPPIESLDKDGQHKGLAKDLLDIIADRLNIRFEPVQGLSWAGVMLSAESGVIDVLGAVTSTPEREKIFDFTEPYLTLPLVIFTRDANPYIHDLSDLEDGVIAVVEDYAVVEYLEKDWPNLKLLLVSDGKEGLQAVASGEATHYIDTLLTTTYNIQRMGLPNIKVAGETPYKYSLRIGVRKNVPYLHSILQKALNSISDSERSAMFSKWRSIQYEHKFDYRLLWKILLGIAVLFTLFFFWNRKLASEIKERKLIEKRLVESERKTGAMSEAIHDGLVMIDDHAKIMYWNKAAEKLFDISSQEAIGKDMHSILVSEESKNKAHRGLEIFTGTGEGPVVGKLQELEALKKDGSRFPVEVGVSAFQIGDKWYAVGTIRDITERLNDQETLKRIRTELQQIFDNAQVGILFIKNQNELYRCNQRASEILGYNSPNKMVGLLSESLHENRGSFETFKNSFYPDLVQGKRVQTEYKLKTKDGMDIWCSLCGTAMDEQLPADLNKGIIWVIDDISEKRTAQQALIESEDRVKTILNSINTGTVIIDAATRIITGVNPVAAKMIGMTREEITGRSCHQFFYPEVDQSQTIPDHLTPVADVERTLHTIDGEEIPILKTIVPVKIDGERQLLESFVNLTNQKEAEYKLQQKLDELERFFKLTLNREEKMIALKEEINALLTKSGKKEKYVIR